MLRWVGLSRREVVVKDSEKMSLVVETQKGFHVAPVSTRTSAAIRISPLPQEKNDDSVIGSDAVMTGCLKMNGRLIVKGRFSGLIEQGEHGGNVYVDEEAVVRGNLIASNALIYGAVEGSVTATLISIENTADVRGQVEYKDIRLKGGVTSLQLTRNTNLALLAEDKPTQQQITNE